MERAASCAAVLCRRSSSHACLAFIQLFPLVWLLDWRVGLIAWGLFAALWLLTKYVSLGSVCAAASMPVTTFFFCGRSLLYTALAVLIAALVIWCHRENITRLLHHQERKFQWHTGTPKEKE